MSRPMLVRGFGGQWAIAPWLLREPKRPLDRPAACTCCKATLPPSSFTITRHATLSSWCKGCQRENVKHVRLKAAARKVPTWSYRG